jgi:hypothetical protein
MRGDDSEFYPGTVVFDRKRTDPRDDPLIVTKAGERTVSDLDVRTRETVLENKTNSKLSREMDTSLGYETRVVSAVYIKGGDDVDPCLGETAYTFPEFRLAPIEYGPDTPTDDTRPHQMALAAFFSEMAETLDREDITISSAEGLQYLAMKSGVDGAVIKRALDRL